jgi:hypothetical protein
MSSDVLFVVANARDADYLLKTLWYRAWNHSEFKLDKVRRTVTDTDTGRRHVVMHEGDQHLASKIRGAEFEKIYLSAGVSASVAELLVPCVEADGQILRLIYGSF